MAKFLIVPQITLLVLPFVAGCSKGLSGTFEGAVRVAPGKTESTDPAYTVAAVKKELESKNKRALTLNSDGTYTEIFGRGVQRGNWRVDGDKLILKDTESNGNPIYHGLQHEKIYRLAEGGREIITDEYKTYGLEFVLKKK
jgi:hypothetical protein